MDDYNFGIDQIVQHHYFSGKNCPQTMRTEGYWQHFLSLVEVEYQMLQYKKLGFTFELEPININYVNNIGRIINRGNTIPVSASYIVNISDGKGNFMKRVFITSVPPRSRYE